LLNNEDGAAAPAAAAPAGVVMGTTAISPIAAQQPVDAAAEARHNKLRKQLDVYGGVAAEFYASSGDDLGGLEWSSGNMQVSCCLREVEGLPGVFMQLRRTKHQL
jgi:hypothetical protein